MFMSSTGTPAAPKPTKFLLLLIKESGVPALVRTQRPLRQPNNDTKGKAVKTRSITSCLQRNRLRQGRDIIGPRCRFISSQTSRFQSHYAAMVSQVCCFCTAHEVKVLLTVCPAFVEGQ
jgi:hypothetical protein